jgi:hypothetical protein
MHVLIQQNKEVRHGLVPVCVTQQGHKTEWFLIKFCVALVSPLCRSTHDNICIFCDMPNLLLLLYVLFFKCV